MNPTPDPEGQREGSLQAPERHPLNWREQGFYDEGALLAELERVYDICHGCRRCFSLCQAFPTLFDLIDETESMELDGVDKQDYWRVVDHCYLCDMCFMTKCPYVPPHPWNIDFPHLMLRAKAVKWKRGERRLRDRILSATDVVGRIAGIPVVAPAVNAANRSPAVRQTLRAVLGVHPQAPLPEYQSHPLRKRIARKRTAATEPTAVQGTRGRVVCFVTCYGNFNQPQIVEDLIAIFEHNKIPVLLAEQERCCGMPKLELGDLEAVDRAKRANVPELARLVDEGWDIVAPIPSCVLMFKQELPLMYPQDASVAKVREAMFDPFEYLTLRHKGGELRTDFKAALGRVAYHVACHLRVQNIGLRTRDVLQLVADTEVVPIERCSGHNGTYAVKAEFHETSMKICKPVARRVQEAGANYFSSDCPMAADQIRAGLNGDAQPTHPLTLLRKAYGI